MPIEPAHEYDSLRQELLGAERYVIERPLAIAALAAAVGLKVFDKPQYIALTIAVSVITFLNLRFTVNRLESSCRIVAYIQLVLEPSASCPWIGWETSLRKYREWIKRKGGKREAAEYATEQLSKASSPTPTTPMYYEPVYWFHVVLMAFSVLPLAGLALFKVLAIAGLALFKQETALWALSLIAAVGLGIWSLVYFLSHRPKHHSYSIERNLVIWQEVFKEVAP